MKKNEGIQEYGIVASDLPKLSTRSECELHVLTTYAPGKGPKIKLNH